MLLKRAGKTKLIGRKKKLKIPNVRRLNLPNSGNSEMRSLQSLSNKSAKKRDNAV